MNVPEEEVNKLLCMIADMENIYISMHREVESCTKSVQYYLFKVSNVNYISKNIKFL